MMNLKGVALLASLLSGCVSTITGSTYSDGRFWYSNVKSASDIAGGPRHDLLVVVDHNGRHVDTFISHGLGTLQSTASSLGPAVVTAAGQAGASALVRPARNTTNVTMDVSGTAGAGTTSSTTSSVSGTNATAAGGTGGVGGTGGAGGGSTVGQRNQITP